MEVGEGREARRTKELEGAVGKKHGRCALGLVPVECSAVFPQSHLDQCRHPAVVVATPLAELKPADSANLKCQS